MRSPAWQRALAVFALSLLGPARAGADPRTAGVRFAWVRGAGADACPDAVALARDVSRRLGRNPFAEEGNGSIEGVFVHESDRWVVRIYVRDAGGALVGSREIASDAPTCEPLGVATVLAVALAIDPDAALRPPPAAPAPPRAVPAPPAAVVRPRPSPVRTILPSNRGTGVTLRAVGSLGLLPGAAPGVAIATTLRVTGRLFASSGAVFFPEVHADRFENYEVGLTAAWLSACLELLRNSRFAFGACAGGLAGSVDAVVRRGLPVSSGGNAWGALSGSATLSARIVGALTAEVGVEGVVPLVRHRFYVEGATGTVFQQSVVAGTLFAGMGVQFW